MPSAPSRTRFCGVPDSAYSVSACERLMRTRFCGASSRPAAIVRTRFCVRTGRPSRNALAPKLWYQSRSQKASTHTHHAPHRNAIGRLVPVSAGVAVRGGPTDAKPGVGRTRFCVTPRTGRWRAPVPVSAWLCEAGVRDGQPGPCRTRFCVERRKEEKSMGVPVSARCARGVGRCPFGGPYPFLRPTGWLTPYPFLRLPLPHALPYPFLRAAGARRSACVPVSASASGRSRLPAIGPDGGERGAEQREGEARRNGAPQ